MASPRILFLAGSARKTSFNKTLARAAAQIASDMGADATCLDMADYPLPLFCEDLEAEQGIPEHALKLKKMFIQANGFILCCPEYNGSITPLLKNTIDWLSRPNEGEAPLACFKGKVAGLMAASPGSLGGLRGLVHVRAILSGIGTLVIPEQIALTNAANAFAPDGSLADDTQQQRATKVVTQVVEIAQRLHRND